MATPLKDRFFQRPFFERLTSEIAGIHLDFDQPRFFEILYGDGWDALELKARMRRASMALGATLPADFPEALRIVMAVELHFDSFDHLLFADFVECFGVEHCEASLDALEVLTRTTAEFAVRPFIRRYTSHTMARMLAWASHPEPHVRRLASEGCRPRLPWGTALEELKRDPSPILPILERLKDDPSDAVRRSVANNLGDIAKDHPKLAVSIGAAWIAQSKARQPLVRHALRDLLKKGNQKALDLFGVGKAAKVSVERLSLSPKRVVIGGKTTLRFTLRSTGQKPQRLRLEYALTYLRPAGRTARKVFKIADIELGPRASNDIVRKLDFADRSIRKHHPGRHVATIFVNGREIDSVDFSLRRQ
jgi:3-methyladenine DNA glycosylase AlkC